MRANKYVKCLEAEKEPNNIMIIQPNRLSHNNRPVIIFAGFDSSFSFQYLRETWLTKFCRH